jgi:hypothetical protein
MRRSTIVMVALIVWASAAPTAVFAQEGMVTARSRARFAKVAEVPGAYMFSGNALATHLTTGNVGGARNGRDPADVASATARVRYSF